MSYLWNQDGSSVTLYNGDGTTWGTWSDGATAVTTLGGTVTINGIKCIFVQFPAGSVQTADNKDATGSDLFAYAPSASVHASPQSTLGGAVAQSSMIGMTILAIAGGTLAAWLASRNSRKKKQR